MTTPDTASDHRQKVTEHQQGDAQPEAQQPPPPIGNEPIVSTGERNGKEDDVRQPKTPFGIRYDSVVLTLTLLVLGIYTCEVHRQTTLLTDSFKFQKTQSEIGAKTVDRVLTANETLAKAAQTSADANQTIANAAKKSADNSDRIARGNESAVKAAQDATRLDQRARIGVRDSTEFHFSSNAPLSANAVVVNTGKTPALNMRTHLEITWVKAGMPLPPFDLSSKLITIQVLPAGQVSNIPISGAIDADLFRAVNNAEKTLYLRVLVTYDDVFTAPHSGIGVHRTEACSVFVPKTGALYGCEFGNYAD
jgi:hypothetical protein